MSNVHKYGTISFRPSEYERLAIEERIKVSGMRKKDFYIKSCIYNKICVVGKKETIEPLLLEVKEMHNDLVNRFENTGQSNMESDMQEEYMEFLKAVIWMLDGAKYLWEE